jgi:hypothetical protein
MDSEWVNQSEIRLETDLSVLARLSGTAGALLLLGWEITAYFRQADARSPDGVTILFVLIICGLLIFSLLYSSNDRWTIGSNEIRIERKRIIGRRRVEVVRRADIIEIIILREGTEFGPRVWILLHRFSGPSVESPVVRNGARADELKAEIARRLLMTAAIKQI